MEALSLDELSLDELSFDDELSLEEPSLDELSFELDDASFVELSLDDSPDLTVSSVFASLESPPSEAGACDLLA